MNTKPASERIRLDKWLWAARFFKTRALSAEAIDKGRVSINGQPAKASREPRVGDVMELSREQERRTIVVRALSAVRGPASAAALLYEETAESIAQRLAAAEQRRLAPEPALTQTMGRPTKRDRRDLKAWGDRWSASLDEE
ncbi:MAG: RNA-binding S4 domain-containing protein [Hydrogenophaga sp.]|uniref:RNA-binding S4 domain-containing protein n=1 Tax=Hydrogenophaga sp. TaxID=1904254 RepID=UPI001E05BBC6|nr:RNA-binding S4 domain-containing protein [Hydrogenophaga sp.]MBX3610578.1 RNA-binding S4 domain-containing protein [Hydrogenophaga sp.]